MSVSLAQLSRVGGLKGVYIDFQNLHICYTFVRVWTSHQKVFQNLTINEVKVLGAPMWSNFVILNLLRQIYMYYIAKDF